MKSFQTFSFTLVLLSSFFIPHADAATINAANCSQAAVTAAIGQAVSGDTVFVPPGSCTWSSNLIITKGITLQGAGIDVTKITSNYTATNPGNSFDWGNFLIIYSPSSPQLNEPFRITGFTFDMNNIVGGLLLSNPSTTVPNKIRIDHNKFRNAYNPTGTMRNIITQEMYGVIDNNQFVDNRESNLNGWGTNEGSWTYLTFNFGSADCMYFEDNTITGTGLGHAAGLGGRYCIRYNTYTHTDTSGLYPWIDMHGNQPGANLATMGTEFYGNTITLTTTNGIRMVDQRGGKLVAFYNNANVPSGGVSSQVREENADSLNPPATGPDGQPQHVSDSYYWNNRKNNSTLVVFSVEEDTVTRGGAVNDPPVLVEYVTHWQQRTATFDGTIDEVGSCGYYNGNACIKSGVGCGTLANRPVTCTTGVAYWATNQSCSDLTGMIGANPATPISGTLYKCTSTNTWSAYYTPYKYPHPLRLESPAQTCGNNLREGTEACDGTDLAGQTCISQGFTGGTLSCNSQCTGFVTTVCTSSPQYFLPEQYVQAESGTLNGMQTGTSGTDTYIYSSANNAGSASYSFQIDTPGRYLLEARVNSNNDAGQNSFYVGLDSEAAQGNSYYTYDTTIVSVFTWDNVNRRGTGTTVSEFDPFIWDLTQGTHTFWFYGKESNTWLDQIILRRACAHKSDSSCDGCVSDTELFAFIDLWKVNSSNPTLRELIEAIGLWKRGCL